MGAEKLEKLMQVLPTLKEQELAEVISLVDKIKEQSTTNAIKSLKGKYKGQISSVDEFLRNKQQERIAEREKETR